MFWCCNVQLHTHCSGQNMLWHWSTIALTVLENYLNTQYTVDLSDTTALFVIFLGDKRTWKSHETGLSCLDRMSFGARLSPWDSSSSAVLLAPGWPWIGILLMEKHTQKAGQRPRLEAKVGDQGWRPRSELNDKCQGHPKVSCFASVWLFL